MQVRCVRDRAANTITFSIDDVVSRIDPMILLQYVLGVFPLTDCVVLLFLLLVRCDRQ